MQYTPTLAPAIDPFAGTQVRNPLALTTFRLVAVALVLLSFLASYTLERYFHRQQYLSQFNVVFDADPNVYLSAFGNGWVTIPLVRHPGVSLLIGVPVRCAAKLISSFTGKDEITIRAELALLVVPLSQALKTCALIFLLLQFGCPLWAIAFTSVLDLLSWSRVVFGSVPDSFALTGCLLTIAFALAVAHVRQAQNQEHTPRLLKNPWTWAWLVLTAVATGVTTSNIAVVGTIMLITHCFVHNSLAEVVRRTFFIGVSSVLIVLWMALATVALFQVDAGAAFRGDHRQKVYSVSRMLEMMIPAYGNTMLSRPPEIIPNSLAIANGDKHQFAFSYTTAASDSSRGLSLTLFGITFVVSMAGAFVWWQDRRKGRMLMIICAATVAMNLAINLLFHGMELFLYSQHWQPAVLLLIAGLVQPAARGWRVPVACAFAACAAFTTAISLSHVLHIAGSSLPKLVGGA